MALPWGLVVFLIGIVWGLIAPGRQGKLSMLFSGLMIGLILGLVFAILGYAVENNPMGLGDDIWSFAVAFFLLTLVFVLGVWVGDLIESMARRRPA